MKKLEKSEQYLGKTEKYLKILKKKREKLENISQKTQPNTKICTKKIHVTETGNTAGMMLEKCRT